MPVGVYLWEYRRPNLLLRNDRGLLSHVGPEVGLTDSLSTDNAVWLDYDRDGNLDLYTGNVAAGDDLDADPANDSNPSARNRLYRNRGDGSFTDVTAEVGLDVSLHRLYGGSNGGMAAADFNDDGWPDLYVGVYGDRNRLFLSDGQGRFRDATTDEIGDPGHAFDVTVGDIDNDGDLDLYQAAGGGGGTGFRSLLLLNLGGGGFADVTGSAGLSGPQMDREVWNARFGDLDNDGDLDLLTCRPHRLFLNDGNGFFSDATERSGIPGAPVVVTLGDYDHDGYLDACFGWGDASVGPVLYRNQGTGSHWLEVELVGVRSNASGIGARVVATAGQLRQVREVLGGQGFSQDEMIAHFGLGERTQVDELEVRWPSGQVDVLAGVPADQRLRVFEGSPGYWVAHPATVACTDTLVAGVPADFALRVQPARPDAAASITRVVADLSGMGGGAAMPLEAGAGGSYSLRAPLPAPATNQMAAISVLVELDTRLGPDWSRLTRAVTVVPAADAVIYDDGLGPGWRVGDASRAETLELASTGRAATGAHAVAVRGRPGGWVAIFETASSVATTGYECLHFAFHPGDAVLPARRPTFTVRVATDAPVDLLDGDRVGFARAEWQVVEIPMARLGWPDSVRLVQLTGNSTGTWYLDDIRLVAARPSRPATAVVETQAAPVPRAFGLQMNHPNPFNGSTVIRFGLPGPGPVELAVYNLAGQKVATLVREERPAGTHTVTWDGRDGEGQPLASGVYLCQLRARGQGSGLAHTRKLLLVR
ncbi:MAG: FG-GAP-like repeat-containing protein [Candidatus Latescibacterota bacterium]